MKKMFIPHWVQYTAVGPLCRDDLKIISANPNPMVTDPIANLFSSLRNGYLARKSTIRVPFSKMKERLVVILKKNKYIQDYVVEGDVKKTITITLNPVTKHTKHIPSFKRISKPGCRLYVKSSEIKKSHNGYGIYILSTPKGVIT